MTQNRINPNSHSGWGLIFSCWLIAMAALFGSLFMSEVMGLQPCVLCWWQRIFIYPLALLFLVGLFPPDTQDSVKTADNTRLRVDDAVLRYTLPLALTGFGFAVYHALVYAGVIPEALQPCNETLSCAEVNLQLMGFVTIPMLSIFAYGSIITLLLIYRKRSI